MSYKIGGVKNSYQIGGVHQKDAEMRLFFCHNYIYLLIDNRYIAID